MDEERKLTILLGSLPTEYELLVTILENSIGLTLMEVKEKLLKENDKKSKKKPRKVHFAYVMAREVDG